MQTKAEFWRGRRVFLTGHTGFKGIWLGLWLTRAGAQVHGFALPPATQPNFFSRVRPSEWLAADRRGDIRDLEAVRQAMQACQPQVIFHLAAQPIVRASYADPIATYATNVMGTAHVLEAARGCPSVSAIVIITSDKCYENREWPWPYRENDRLGGHDPYSNSKACAELVTTAYRRSFFGAGQTPVAVATARAGNVIGGGDWSQDRLIPDLMRAFLAGESARIRNPHAIRPWQHVLEPLRGYAMLAEQLCKNATGYGEGWNFGTNPDDAQTVSQIVRQLAKLWGPTAAWEEDAGPHPHEAGVLKLDSSQAANRLGWRPWLKLETALQLTVEWYRAWAQNKDMLQYTHAQMDAYLRQDCTVAAASGQAQFEAGRTE